jgi:oligopeptide/dipeptide ABC transporter ATP-binding protein
MLAGTGSGMNEVTNNDSVLQVHELKKYYPIIKGLFRKEVGNVKAVDGVSFAIKRGQTFGLVGESGCGKTTLGRCILQVIPLTSGKIYFEGEEINCVNKTRPKSLSSKMQVVFQDPSSSLNPRHKVKDIIKEPLIIQGNISKKEIDSRLSNLYEMVGLEDYIGDRYPHMLSGGQQQRVAIARAMIVQPSFVVCDEPVSSLDVSIRAQIINLLRDLQKNLKVSYLFISHDLSVVKYISHMVAVMYLGKIVEISPSAELYHKPLHPYTRTLLSAVPVPDPAIESKRERLLIKGEIPSSINVPSGCAFHTRCQIAKSKCSIDPVSLQEIMPGHWVSCHEFDNYTQIK